MLIQILLSSFLSSLPLGTSILIENMGEAIDATLNPVIGRKTIKKGSRLYIALGDKEVELNPDFRLFLHTKLSNPHYAPEVRRRIMCWHHITPGIHSLYTFIAVFTPVCIYT